MKNQNQNKDLNLEIDNIINDMSSITNLNHNCLKNGNKVLDKIENKRLPQIDNEIKKSNWFSKGIKSTGSWIYNIFKTPEMKKTTFNEKDYNKNKNIDDDNLDSVNKIRNINKIICDDQILAREQGERIDNVHDKIKKRTSKIRDINNRID